MSRAAMLVATALGVAVAPSAAAETILLQDGVGARFTMPASSQTSSFAVEVPAGTGALQITLDGPDNDADVDLYLRHGSAIRGLAAGDLLTTLEESHYYSQSFGNDESIVVTRSGTVPLRSGTWHLGLANLGSAGAEVTLTARLLAAPPVADLEVLYDYSGQVNYRGERVSCNTAPWREASLGAQRTAAMQQALANIRDALQPVVPIRILACWVSQEENVLASARAADIMLHDLGVDPARFGGSGPLQSAPMAMVPERYTLYSSASVSNRAGAPRCQVVGGSCATSHDIAVFIGQRDSLPVNQGRWYYGLDRQPAQNQYDFISVLMHEIVHGLGFYGLINIDPDDDEFVLGERLFDYDDAYGNQVRWVTSADPGTPILELSTADRAMALTSGFQLKYGGPRVIATYAGSVPLYAPTTPNPGSTLSHFGLASELMYFASPIGRANHQLATAQFVLEDVGWLRTPKQARAFPTPLGGQYYDPARSGHGFAMYPVAGVDNLWFLVFYTYDDAGKPEFYVAAGPIIDGVFMPARDATTGDSLFRPLADGSPDPAADFDGQIRVDFNEAAKSPVCKDGFPNRTLDDPQLAVVTWTIDDGVTQSPQGQWCLQPLTGGTVADDKTNLFNSPTDPGWGLSTLSFASSAGEGFAFQIYYQDGQGKPRWGLVTTGDYQPGAMLTVQQPEGYCRSCPKPAELGLVPVGTMSVDIRDPRVNQAAGSSISADIGFDGAASGRFQRTNAAIVSRAVPRE